jgi:hypothetical protein
MPDPLEGHRWPSNVITYTFATTNFAGQPLSYSSFITDPRYQAVVTKAAAAWSAVSGIQFQLVPDSPTVDIRVGFAMLHSAQGGDIGTTYWSWSGPYYRPGTVVAAEDPAEVPLVPQTSGDFRYSGFSTGLLQAFEHELGHALGLAHNPSDPNAVMFPSEGPANNSGPDQSDIVAIQALYGPPAPRLEFIKIVREDYLTGLAREPDPNGLNHWADFLGSGGTAAQLAQMISQSPEFQSLHSQQSDPAYIDSLYQSGLGRPADAGGLQNWLGALQGGTLDRAGVLTGIAQSAESQQHLQFV